MVTPNNSISFRLFSIQTDEFATFEIGSPDGVPDLTIDVTFSSDLNQRLVACVMGFKFSEEEKILTVLKTTCLFEIEEKSWNNSIIQESKYIIPKNILEHFCVITVGASRGILHTKTENTPFNKYMIPTLNITQFIPSDVEFDTQKK